MDSINKSITENTKTQMTKIDSLMASIVTSEQLAKAQNDIQKQFNLLEQNINISLKNIQENGIKAETNNEDHNLVGMETHTHMGSIPY